MYSKLSNVNKLKDFHPDIFITFCTFYCMTYFMLITKFTFYNTRFCYHSEIKAMFIAILLGMHMMTAHSPDYVTNIIKDLEMKLLPRQFTNIFHSNFYQLNKV